MKTLSIKTDLSSSQKPNEFAMQLKKHKNFRAISARVEAMVFLGIMLLVMSAPFDLEQYAGGCRRGDDGGGAPVQTGEGSDRQPQAVRGPLPLPTRPRRPVHRGHHW